MASALVEMLLSSSLLLTVAVGAVTFVALHRLSGGKHHPSEPTVLPPRVPIVGHLLGMALQGGRYIKSLGLSHNNEPIFTLPVPGSRIYVITDPSLAAAVQRNTKSLSFTPLIPDITKRVLGLDASTVKIVRQNLDPEPGAPRGFLADMHDKIYSSLGPGHYLSSLSCDVSQELCKQLDGFGESLADFAVCETSVNLIEWVRHLVTRGTAKYLFGPQNPIEVDSSLEAAFWSFDHGIGSLLAGVFPSITAAEAYRGRERMVSALLDYFNTGKARSASSIIRERMSIEKQYGMSSDMMARSALSFLFASVVNTTTSTLWVILRLYADPSLLQSVRKEVSEALSASQEKLGHDRLSINLVKDACPTLASVLRESLRLGSENFSVRMVKEDTMLAERYLLKKGSVVQIAGGVMHSDPDIWGKDVNEFNPRRFLKQNEKPSNIHPAAFRGFGGGKSLCPGRHFATNEILTFAAMIVHGYDMSSPDGRNIRVPQKNDRVMPVHILEPKKGDCPRTTIRAREQARSLKSLKIVM